MNDSQLKSTHFTGRLVNISCPEYTTPEGEVRRKVIIKLESDERVPMTLILKLNRQMGEELLSLRPSSVEWVITAYLSFRTFTYQARDGVRELTDISAWKLEITDMKNNQFYVINRSAT